LHYKSFISFVSTDPVHTGSLDVEGDVSSSWAQFIAAIDASIVTVAVLLLALMAAAHLCLHWWITRKAPPAGSAGLPGDGADAVTKIVTYNLVGSGGIDMSAHIGHTVEIVGDVAEFSEAQRASKAPSVVTGQLHVTSARHIADRCVGDP
jgi:hypothetical protein